MKPADVEAFFTTHGIKPGDKLRLTFRTGTGPKLTIDESQKASLAYLGGMAAGGNLVISELAMAMLYAIVGGGFYDHDNNRHFTVTIPTGFDLDWFVHRLHRDLEAIAKDAGETLPEHLFFQVSPRSLNKRERNDQQMLQLMRAYALPAETTPRTERGVRWFARPCSSNKYPLLEIRFSWVEDETLCGGCVYYSAQSWSGSVWAKQATPVSKSLPCTNDPHQAIAQVIEAMLEIVAGEC